MRWTPAEDQVLAELLGTGLTFREVADQLDDTPGAVSARAYRIGLRSTGKASRPPAKPKPEKRSSPSDTFRPRQWTAEEDALLSRLYAAGEPMWKIGQALHVATTTASMRARVLGLVEVEAVPARDARWTCGHCATRSDAPLDFGCAKCLPLRRMAA